MDASQNPYAPPQASLDPHAQEAGGCWRDGNAVVLPNGGDLPPRCVKCNAPAETPVKARTYYWHHPALYLIALVALLIYAIVALIVRKKTTVHPGLCEEHRRKRTWGLALGWLGGLGGPVLMIASTDLDSCGLGLFGLGLFFVGLVGGLVLARILYPERIDERCVRLKGAGAAFLDSLPLFNG